MKTTYDIQLTPNFKLSEFVNTSHSKFEEITYEQFHNLFKLAKFLQFFRDEFKTPIYINSGYRSENVNKIVGGHPLSFHLYGLACDFTTRNSEIDAKIFAYIGENYFCKELIKYPTFIHLVI